MHSPWLTGFCAHTHTCSEISYRITDVECIKRAKNTSVKSDRNGWMIRSEKLCEGNLSTSLLEGLTSSDAAQSDCENPCKLKLSSKMTSTRGPHTKVQVLHLLRWITHTHMTPWARIHTLAARHSEHVARCQMSQQVDTDTLQSLGAHKQYTAPLCPRTSANESAAALRGRCR